MAKRQGGELNHENWNQETEPEEAGQFRQANPGALKGRVIKTARRRKVVGSDEAAASEKTAFSGFGGFAASKTVDASSAFSFIGKPADGEDKSVPAAGGGGSGAFVFGGSSTSKPGGETSGFSFGKPNFGAKTVENSEPLAKKSASSMFGSFGGASEDKETKPMFGTSSTESKNESTTFGAFSFGSKSKDKSPSPAKVDEAPKSDLMSMFKPAPGWSCSTCMVSNPVDKTSCLACETPKPGSKPVEKTAPTFGGAAGGFSFGDASKSTSNTSGFSFGASANKSEENKENSATSGFSFGAKKQSSDNGATVGGFSFGNKSVESSSDKPATVGGFSFGNKSVESSSDKSATGGFSFGAKTAETKTDKPSESTFSLGAKTTDSTKSNDKSGSETFSFGAKSEGEKTAPLGAFVFGSSASKSVKESTGISTEKTSLGGGFSFGSSKSTISSSSPLAATSKGAGEEENSNSNSNSNNSIPQAEENSKSCSSREESPSRATSVPSKEYLAHLKALNMQVAAWINKHLEQNPLVLLSPVFNDYDKHLKEITSKYKPEEIAKKSETKVSTTFSIDSSSSTVTTSSSQPSTTFGSKSSISTKDTSKSVSPFGAFANTEKPASTPTAPFSFGGLSSSASTAPQSTPAFGTFGSSSAAGGFSFGLAASSSSSTTIATSAAATTATTEEAKDDDEDSPPVVEIKQVAEDDAIYSKKCKLFYKKDGSYVEKGVGMLYLKNVDGDKTQLLVRADTNLGNVLLNILLSSQIPTTRVGKNNVMMVCVPNPPVDPKADSSAPCPMLIRVKDAEAADELKAKIDECKEK